VTDQLARLKDALADRYTIERELGQGGMATVYLARDLKHDRDVALKVLRPELAATLGPERFLREIKIAAQLQHPNILPVHDSGEAAGFLYYVMPFVEGHSLRERLAKEGELPVPEAARILRDVADALSAAHAKGVVHRDIKPENILLTGRHALVADFGVAKAVSEATGRQTLTTAGVALGTPTYMSPEQAAADPHTDHRADLYAFGVMAYEMLAGQPPFSAPTPQALLAAHVTEPPLEVTQRRATIPAPLAQLIMRCLAKKPADRPQTADELLPVLESFTTPSGGVTPTDGRPVPAVQLRRRLAIPIALIAVVVLAVAGYALWRSRAGAAPAADMREPVLVLPFEERVTSAELRGVGLQLADRIEAGITEATLGAVLQRRTAAALAESAATPDVLRRVARASGAATLVTGVVSQRDDSVEVTSQVLRTRDDKTLFSLSAERGRVADLGRVVEAATERALGAVGAYLSPEWRAIDVTLYAPPGGLQEFRLMTRAYQVFDRDDYVGALSVLSELSRRDTTWYLPAFYSASAFLNIGRQREADSVQQWLEARRNRLTTGETLMLDELRSLRRSPEEEFRKSQNALRLDSGQTWVYLAMRTAYLTNHPTVALRYYARRDTSVALSRDWRSWFGGAANAMHTLGRYTDELALARDARTREPEFLFYAAVEARALIGLGKLAQLEQLITASRSLESSGAPGQLMLFAGLELWAHSRRPEARAMWERALAWNLAQPPGSPEERETRQNIAGERYYLGQYAQALPLLTALAAEAPADRSYRAGQAYIAAKTGDTAAAVRTLTELRADTTANDTYPACILALLGRKEEAVAALRDYLNRGGRFDVGGWHTYPELDGLRDYPPFVALVALKD